MYLGIICEILEAATRTNSVVSVWLIDEHLSEINISSSEGSNTMVNSKTALNRKDTLEGLLLRLLL